MHIIPALTNGLNVIALESDLAGVSTQISWQVIAPAGHGVFRQAGFADIEEILGGAVVAAVTAMRCCLRPHC